MYDFNDCGYFCNSRTEYEVIVLGPHGYIFVPSARSEHKSEAYKLYDKLKKSARGKNYHVTLIKHEIKTESYIMEN